ncbi:MAG: hypothetical protein U0802_22305 [Candidatus Binatia bacterium]
MARRRLTWRSAVLLTVGGVLAALLAIELGVRIATHSLLALHGNEVEDCCYTDPLVGRLIQYRGSGHHPTKGFTMSVGDHGIRLNDRPTPAAVRPLILAVGDSFAFGDGVDDRDAWPAVLEEVSGQRVINAGMIGFGLDQAVLRAEQLIDVYRPDTLVVAFIPHDILRCEMSYWSGFSKPYFEVADGSLRLHPAEVPPPVPFASLKRLLSLSMTLDLLYPRYLHWQGPEALAVHHQGREVACLLMERLAALARAHGTRVVVLAHPQQPATPDADRATKDAVLACARANGLLALDLFPVFEAIPADQQGEYFERHFTAKGYRLVATELAAFLAAQAAAPPRS